MATTPSGTKFIGVSSSVNTDKRKSELSNSYQVVSNLSEISDVVKDAPFTIDPNSVGEAVTFTRLDYEDTVDVIIPGELEIARDSYEGGIYNKAIESSWNNSSPADTQWNSKYIDPLLSGFAKCPLLVSDNLPFDTFKNSLDGNVGVNILHTELIFKYDKRSWIIKFHQWTTGGNGGGFSYTRQEIFKGIEFVRPNNATDTVDIISDGLIIKRNNIRGIFNAALESEYDNNAYQSPLGTEWNSIYTDGVNNGWDDLTNVRKRVYSTWREAIDANPTAAVEDGLQLVMHDLSTDLYYIVRFTDWTSNNGGGFEYQRFLIPVNQGIRFSDGTYMDTAPEGVSVDTNNNLIIADNSDNLVEVGNGATQLVDYFSGMLIVNDHYDGRVETWIAGGGDAVLLGATNLNGDPCGSTLTMASNGYEWTNLDNLTGPFTFTVIKTRQGS